MGNSKSPPHSVRVGSQEEFMFLIHRFLTASPEAVTVYDWVIVPVNGRWIPIHWSKYKCLRPCEHFQLAVDSVLDAMAANND